MNMVQTETEWLSLSDYSTEYGVSVSTLRRRIKNKKVKSRLIQGKYYLPRHPLPSEPEAFAPVPNSKANARSVTPPMNTDAQPSVMLDELKKAYLHSLQSKEDQIIQLKQQISDLKTLVLYLERENSRLNPKAN